VSLISYLSMFVCVRTSELNMESPYLRTSSLLSARYLGSNTNNGVESKTEFNPWNLKMKQYILRNVGNCLPSGATSHPRR